MVIGVNMDFSSELVEARLPKVFNIKYANMIHKPTGTIFSLNLIYPNLIAMISAKNNSTKNAINSNNTMLFNNHKSKEMKATISAYKRFFDTRDGKLILNDLMKACHMTSSTMDKDPYETAFNEGARSVVLRILKTTNTNMEQLNELIKRLEEEQDE